MRDNLTPPTTEQASELSKQFNTVDEIKEGDSIYAFYFNLITELSERVQELEKKLNANVSD